VLTVLCPLYRSSWSLGDLADSLGLHKDSLRKKMGVWINRGFISEGPKDPSGDPTYVRYYNLIFTYTYIYIYRESEMGVWINRGFISEGQKDPSGDPTYVRYYNIICLSTYIYIYIYRQI